MKTIKVFCLWSQAFSSPKCQPSIAPKIPPCVTQNNVPYVPKPARFPPPLGIYLLHQCSKKQHTEPRPFPLYLLLIFFITLSLSQPLPFPLPVFSRESFFGAPFTHPSSEFSSCTNPPPCLLVNYS